MEGVGLPAAFLVTLSAPQPLGDVEVYHDLKDGTATAERDYRPFFGTLTFRPGQTSKSILVDIIDDRQAEPTETFQVVLLGVSNASLGGPRFLEATGTIHDDDTVVAAADAYQLDEDQVLATSAASGVLANDEGEGLTAILVAGPTHGTVRLNPDGSFTYTPNADFNGADRFTYQAQFDSQKSEVTAVTPTVVPVNDPPRLAPIPFPVVGVGQRLQFQVQATDGDGDTNLTYSLTRAPQGAVIGPWSGFVAWTPDATQVGVHTFVVTVTDPAGASDSREVVVTVLAPPTVQGVVINDGAVQRSMVNSLTVTFSGVVTLDAGAFELRKQGGGLVRLDVSTSVVNGKTVAVLTFAGPGIIGGSLADGNYTLTIHADRVHDAAGQALDGDGNGVAGGDHAVTFHRRFGDSDGDRDVDVRDLRRFLSTFWKRAGDTGYLGDFDFDASGSVGLFDLFQFVARLGRRLRP